MTGPYEQRRLELCEARCSQCAVTLGLMSLLACQVSEPAWGTDMEAWLHLSMAHNQGLWKPTTRLMLGHHGSVYIRSCNLCLAYYQTGLGTPRVWLPWSPNEVERIEKNFKTGLSSLLFCFGILRHENCVFKCDF